MIDLSFYKGKKVLLKDADLDEILLFLQNTKN